MRTDFARLAIGWFDHYLRASSHRKAPIPLNPALTAAVPTAVDELRQGLPAEPFAGTIVVDVMNYHPGRDRHVSELGEDVTEG